MVRNALLCLLAAALVSGCVRVPDRQWSSTRGPEPSSTSEPEAPLLLIEIGDDGKFFDPAQFDRMREWLAQDEAPILLFVHGWHHNAQPDDGHLASFRRFLAQVQGKVGHPVKGVYVGWRGDSLDPVVPMPEPAGDFLTIFGRKTASEHVGEGDLRRIVDYLSGLGEQRNVVLMGHSLGGSALYYASRQLITQPIHDHTEIILINPAIGSREIGELSTAVKMAAPPPPVVGNMKSNTSISAASTAMGLLAHANRRLIVFQAKGDSAVGFFFRLTGHGTPIGFDRARITHESCAGSLDRCGALLDRGNLRAPAMKQFTAANGESLEVSPDGCVFSLAQGRFFIKVGRGDSPEACRDVNRLPIWVVFGDSSVSASHNDIMNAIQADAVSSLIAWRLNPAVAPAM